MKVVWVAAVLGVAGAAGACMWDYDTLGQEIKGLPELQDVIAGRFEVNPPEYYERRIELMEERRKAGKLDLDGYDNAAMAHDRLGHTKEALAWLEAKRKRLVAEQPKVAGDDWYRFYANRGTVYSHEWSRSGMGKDTSLLDKALADLDEAVRINPKAHFGRETVQIEILKLTKSWRAESEDSGSNWATYVDKDRVAVQKGIIGIMSLGVGWNSPDLYVLLASTVDPDDAAVQDGLLLRAKQFRDAGQKHWINESDEVTFMGADGEAEDYNLLVAQVETLSANGDQFRKTREDFVEARLAEGKHPDKDKDFWDGLLEMPRVSLPSEPIAKPRRESKLEQLALGAATGFATILAVAGTGFYFWRRRRGSTAA